MDAKTMGNIIAKLRKGAGMTQSDLALKLDVSNKAVSKWENDISCPDVMTLPTLAQKLGCTVDELLTGRESAPQPTIVPEENRKPFEQMMLKIVVNSCDGDHVRVNLPLPLLQVLLQSGVDVSAFGGKGSLDNLNIDWKAIMLLVENGTIGKLVEVTSADGDVVEIVVE